jgi:hypothetical protein
VLGGHIAYIAADAGMVIVDLNDPLKPRHLATVPLDGARASALQFRYLFVTDKSGLRVIDVTLPASRRCCRAAWRWPMRARCMWRVLTLTSRRASKAWPSSTLKNRRSRRSTRCSTPTAS